MTNQTGILSLPRILVVDDHPNAAFILAQVLKGLRPAVEVITAHSGEEALSLIGDGSVDIVITDFLMPGMSGLELIEKLKKARLRRARAHDSDHGLWTSPRCLSLLTSHGSTITSPSRLIRKKYGAIVSDALGGRPSR